MKQRFNELLRSTGVKGIEELITHLEQIGFYESPASTSLARHACFDGGLLKHSLNVAEFALDLFNHTDVREKLTSKDIIIAALLHDVGKAGSFGLKYYNANVLKSGKVSSAKPYETNKELSGVQHQDASVLIVSKFIDLSKNQYIAIKYHNGLYTADGRDIKGNETPLYLLIHFADMWASRVLE